MGVRFLVILVTASLLGVVYSSLIRPANQGYGNMGYRGYYRSPGWNWNGVSVYHDREVRRGSISGSSFRGRGPGLSLIHI